MTGSHSRKFPLTQHKTGQWCKKIHGKLYYFGTEKQAAYERYLREAANLHAGDPRADNVNLEWITVKDLANHYLVWCHYSAHPETDRVIFEAKSEAGLILVLSISQVIVDNSHSTYSRDI